MIGWLTSIFDIIAGTVGFIIGFVQHIFTLVTYCISFVTGLYVYLRFALIDIPFFTPLLICITIFVSVAVVRLCVSLGGH